MNTSQEQQEMVESVPKHVAIIMDGNGRWAEGRKLPRFQGHKEGVKRVEEIISEAERCGIKVLTLFTFSTENWQRPKLEVSMLMGIFCSVLERKLRVLMNRGIRLMMIGRREGIPKEVMACIDRTIEATRDNKRMTLNIAFNYGSRTEILDGIRQLIKNVQGGDLNPDDINEDLFSQELYTKDIPDPDLLIRTSGEKRISNFLLWQLSYSELYFVDKCWPDFTVEELHLALKEYAGRERRFGRVKTNNG